MWHSVRKTGYLRSRAGRRWAQAGGRRCERCGRVGRRGPCAPHGLVSQGWLTRRQGMAGSSAVQRRFRRAPSSARREPRRARWAPQQASLKAKNGQKVLVQQQYANVAAVPAGECGRRRHSGKRVSAGWAGGRAGGRVHRCEAPARQVRGCMNLPCCNDQRGGEGGRHPDARRNSWSPGGCRAALQLPGAPQSVNYGEKLAAHNSVCRVKRLGVGSQSSALAAPFSPRRRLIRQCGRQWRPQM